MLKEVLLIHPVGQLAACVFAVFNLATGLSRRWLVPALHINFGVLFYALMFVGAGVGALSARMAATGGMVLSSTMHVLPAAVFMAVLLCGALSGFMLLKKGRPAWITALHRSTNIAALILFGAQAFTGVRALADVF